MLRRLGRAKTKWVGLLSYWNNITNHEKRYLDRIGWEGVLDACAYTPEWREAVSSVIVQILASKYIQT
jgi:hypothetical protein